MKRKLSLNIRRLFSLVLISVMAATILPANIFGEQSVVNAASITYEPLEFTSTSYNADVVAESSAALSNTHTSEYSGYVSSSKCGWYSESYIKTGGLPTSRIVNDVSGSYSGLYWKLGDYTKNNAVRLAPNGGNKSITFNTVGVYQKLYILATAGGVGTGNNAKMDVVVYYSDGTSKSTSFSVADWFDTSTNYWANKSYMRIYGSGSTHGSTSGGPILFRCGMDIDSTKLIQSVKITNNATNSGLYTCVFGITGVTAAIDKPSNLKLSGCTALNATWDKVSGASSYRIDIATDTNFTKIVGTYNNAVCTTNSCQIKGLETGKQYYARVRAVNSSGGQGPSSSIVSCVSNYQWTYATNGDTFDIHCAVPGCDYDVLHPMRFTIDPVDVVYDRKGHPAPIRKENADSLLEKTGYYLDKIEYYKTTTPNALEGGTLYSANPRDVGYYYAVAYYTNGTKTYTIKDAFKIYLEDTNYAQESLNNQVNELGQRVHPVAGDDVSANLKVILNSSADTIELYKIGSCTWNDNNKDYNDVAWVGEVKEWLNLVDNATKYPAAEYGSMTEFMNTTKQNQSAFYNALLDKDNGVFARTSIKPVATSSATNNSLNPGKGDEDAYYSTLFADLPFGTYAVMAKNGTGVAYSPVVVNVVPYQNGPHTGWYSLYEFECYLKEVAAGINKYINEEDISDTVAYGEDVDFSIELSFPTVYKDRVTISKTDTSVKDYQMYVIDEMSAAYTIKGTPKLRYSLNGTDKVDFLGKPISYYEIADYNPGSGILITEDNIATYTYDSPLSDVAKAEIIGKYAVSKSAPVYNISTPVTDADGVTTFRLTINVHALKAYLKTTRTSAMDYKAYLEYEATVNDNVKVNSDENTNTATIYYEKSNQVVEHIDDTVYGYTYGINVKKYKGNTYGTDDVQGLAGARFKLFGYVGNYAADSDDPVLLEAKRAFDAQGPRSDYYVIEEMSVSPADEDPDDGDLGESDSDDPDDPDKPDDGGSQTVESYDVYKIYTMAYLDSAVYAANGNATPAYDGTFVSVASTDGIKLLGLKEGKYVLAEVNAPIGYNELAEDIYFEINKLSDEEVEHTYKGSRAFFKEMDDNLNTSGMITLDVLNFQGFTLPSTGGIGILLFIILGIGLMGSTVIILVVRRKRTEDWL